MKVYTTDVVVEEQEFAESKNASGASEGSNSENVEENTNFMNIPNGLNEEEMPFN